MGAPLCRRMRTIAAPSDPREGQLKGRGPRWTGRNGAIVEEPTTSQWNTNCYDVRPRKGDTLRQEVET